MPAPTSLETPTPDPPDQVIVPPSHPVAVKLAFSVPHNSVLFVVIIGATGAAPLLIAIVVELPDVPQALLQVAV